MNHVNNFIREWADLYASPRGAYRAVVVLARRMDARELNIRSTWAKSPLARARCRAALELHGTV